MAQNSSDQYRIAALEQKKAAYVDLMAAGSGTPWEDRGDLGTIPAFFRTCWMSLWHPIRLLLAIRRPETTGDTVPFVIGCGLLLGISWMGHAIGSDLRAHRELGAGIYVGWVLRLLITPVATLLLLKLSASVFYKLVSAEDMKSKAPPVLVFNLFAYGMGPSLLALVPVAGPLLAVIWIVTVWILSSSGRLGVKRGASVICTLIVVAAVAGIVLGGGYVGGLLLHGISIAWFGA